jgi:tRNA (guanine-N7-)-methyltransferase
MNQADNPDKFHRPIRSFVLRKGRLTVAQSRALQELWPAFGIARDPGLINASALFGRTAPLVVEIGFGNGEATWRMAQNEQDKDFIGIEVHKPGVGHLLQCLESRQVSNVRIAQDDAVEFINDRLGDHCLDEVRIYFPDPWPKKRHHKRRIIQTGFLDLLAFKMKPGAVLHLATDWQPYAEHMLEVCNGHPAFSNQSPGKDYVPKPDWRPETKYELRGERLGQPSRDILLIRTN